MINPNYVDYYSSLNTVTLHEPEASCHGVRFSFYLLALADSLGDPVLVCRTHPDVLTLHMAGHYISLSQPRKPLLLEGGLTSE